MDVIAKIDLQKEAFVFELDDVLFPHKDYVLQVYYLFANFIEFTEGFPPQRDLVSFMKNVYEHQGEAQVFDQVKQAFGLDEKYRENLERLMVNAVLPLPLLLYKTMEQLLLYLQKSNKKIVVLTKGNPAEQLNKIKYIQWGALGDHLKVYFKDELNFKNLDERSFIAEDLNLSPDQIQFLTE